MMGRLFKNASIRDVTTTIVAGAALAHQPIFLNLPGTGNFQCRVNSLLFYNFLELPSI
jgi:hypothetical protein